METDYKYNTKQAENIVLNCIINKKSCNIFSATVEIDNKYINKP